MKNQFLQSGYLTKNILRIVIVFAIVLSGCGGDDDDPTPKISTVEITEMTPSSPASLKYFQSDPNDRVKISYKYNVIEKEGVRIFVQPYTNGSISPGFLYTTSPLFTDSGTRDAWITVKDENEDTVKVDQLKLAITNSDATTVISEEFIDVDFTFSD